MPIIIAYILEGRSKEAKTEYIRKLTETTVETLNVPADSVRILLREMRKDEYGMGGKTAEELGR